jgi:ABC-2 type transport system ATP-binding protein
MGNDCAKDYAIATQNLTRRYGCVEAVSALNLKVTRQHITGFLGRNGAGKSTTIKMLLGMTHASGGGGTVLGHPISGGNSSREIRRNVAYVGEDKQLYPYMTVEQLIRFTASFYPDWRPERAHRLQDRYQLPSSRKVRALSKGMRTKLALLLALARRPALLILDEPSEGLDPVSIEDLLQSLVTAVSEGTAVFFSSHQIAEVERIAERVCIIDRGKLVAALSLDEMRQHSRRITLGFSTEPRAHDFDIPGVRQIQTSGRQIIVRANHNIDALIERARSLNAVSVDVEPVTLREVFLETVKEAQ